MEMKQKKRSEYFIIITCSGHNTPQDAGPWCRRNFISCRPILEQNQTWLPEPNPKPPPAGFGGGIAWFDANPHPGPLPLGR